MDIADIDPNNPLINVLKAVKLGDANWGAFYAHRLFERPDDVVLDDMNDTMEARYGHECDTETEAVDAFMSQFKFLLERGEDGWYVLESLFIDLLTTLGLVIKDMPLMFAPEPIQEAMNVGRMWVSAHAEEFAKWDHGDGRGFRVRDADEADGADAGADTQGADADDEPPWTNDGPCSCSMCVQDREKGMAEADITAKRDEQMEKLMRGADPDKVFAGYEGTDIQPASMAEVARHDAAREDTSEHTVNDLDALPPIGNDI
jgi:hypothetical protein